MELRSGSKLIHHQHGLNTCKSIPNQYQTSILCGHENVYFKNKTDSLFLLKTGSENTNLCGPFILRVLSAICQWLLFAHC